MTETNTRHSTAYAYVAKRQAIDRLLESIRKSLDAHATEFKSDSDNWGFVGDLSYYADELRSIASSMETDIPPVKESAR